MNKNIALGACLAGAFALGAIAIGFSNAQPSPSARTEAFSANDVAAIRDIVKDYIEENPGVILEALNTHVEAERANAALTLEQKTRDYLPALLSEDGAYATGAATHNAKVVVIEFFDYHCGYCKKASGLMQDLANEDDALKVILRELPILREESELAARYALAARAQNKYQDYHFALLNSGGVLNENRLKDIAKKTGLDIEKLDRDVAADDGIRDSISANRDIARDLQLDGTPSFIVASLDGEFLEVIPGFSPEGVRQAIKDAKAQTR